MDSHCGVCHQRFRLSSILYHTRNDENSGFIFSEPMHTTINVTFNLSAMQLLLQKRILSSGADRKYMARFT